MPPLISVIIPAFNSSGRIRDSLLSVIRQSCSETEIILVDDASNDGTGIAAWEILENSGRPFRILTNPKNLGVSASRNKGLDASRGSYIWFMDSDDTAHPEMLAVLHRLITGTQSDVAFCGYKRHFTDGRPDVHARCCRRDGISGGENFLPEHTPPLWCCLYEADFLRRYSLRFHDGCTSGEDVEFQAKAFCCAQKAAFTPQCLYSYTEHEPSRDNIISYRHNTEAQERTAAYLLEHSRTERVRYLAEHVLMPQTVIRRANLCAMTDSKAGYDSIVRENRNVLNCALELRVLSGKPEVFFKSLAILKFPELYYRMRTK
ncbi:MAG: glycosyltransferase family 2 protein [Synergistaceae bacterium]|nr:glycosyltransferase family 2 protein [Synergistaceae bacterium]